MTKYALVAIMAGPVEMSSFIKGVSPVEKPTAAFALSLAGGILILLGGGIMMMFVFDHRFLASMSAMMGVYHGTMGGFGFMISAMVALIVLGLLSGVVVLVGAVMLNSKPEQRKTWGAIILAFSVVSTFGMGGFFIGAILGVVGGALAIA